MAVTTEMRTEVSQLYVALFGRAPDAEGLGFWTQQLAGGTSLVDIADSMYATDPARSYFPLWMTNSEVVTSFYVNVLGRAPDAEGLAYWTAKMNAPGATPGSVIVDIIDVVANYTGTDPAGLTSAALFDNKVEVAQWYGEHGGGIDNSTAILSTVTADQATADAVMAGSVDPGLTFNLTTGVDTLTGAGSPDVFKATQDTLQLGDSINGAGGNDTLQVSISGDGITLAGFASTSVETISVKSLSTNASTLDLSDTQGVTTLESIETDGASLSFRDIQSVNNTSIRIVDTDETHNFTYDTNAYGAGTDTVKLELQEVRDAAINFGDTDGALGSSEVDQINITSSVRTEGQVSPATANEVSDLNVGEQLATVNITGNADLTVDAALDENISRVNAGTLAAALTLDMTESNDGVGGVDEVTYIGAMGNDHIDFGSTSNDKIVTLGTGDDWVQTGTGEASVNGGAGNDTIITGAQNDLVIAGDGNDTVTDAGATNALGRYFDFGNYFDLGAGNDILTVNGDANNTVVAGSGNDQVYLYGAGNNNVTLGDGSDYLYVAGDGSNTVDAGAGDDAVVLYSNGSKTVTLGDGSDYLYVAGDGDVNATGGTGNDWIEIHGNGVHTIDLGDGNDYLLIDGAGDVDAFTTILGGAGNDTVEITEDHRLNADLGTGNDSIMLRAQDLSVDDTVAGSAGTDTMILTNVSGTPLTGMLGESETQRTTGFEVFDLRDGGITLTLTDNLITSAEDNSVTVVTESAIDTQTVDMTNITAPNYWFTLHGGDAQDIVIADDSTVNSFSTLRFDNAANGIGDSTEDTLRIVDGATVTAADLRNVTGLEIIELVDPPTGAQIWNLTLNKDVINQTTGNADLVITIDPNVPAQSEVHLTIDPLLLEDADSNVRIIRNANVLVYVNDVLVTEPQFGSELLAFNGDYGLYVQTALHFTTNGDNLIGSEFNDVFTADSVDEMQSADSANGMGGFDTLRLNFAVANDQLSLSDQLNNVQLTDISRIEFNTGNNVLMDGLGDYTGISELATGDGNDILDNMGGDILYQLHGGDDLITILPDWAGTPTIDGGLGIDTVLTSNFWWGEDNHSFSIVNVEHVMDGSTSNNDSVTILSGLPGSSQAPGGLVTFLNIENIYGSNDADNIFADSNGGSVTLYGFGGDDTLVVGGDSPSTVYVDGGDGNDTITVTADDWQNWSADPSATVYGGNGDDVITVNVTASSNAWWWWSNNDASATVHGGDGNDTITVDVGANSNSWWWWGDSSGSSAAASVYGDNGDDTISVNVHSQLWDPSWWGDSAATAHVEGGAGNDLIGVTVSSSNAYGWSGSDATASADVYGGTGNDTITVDVSSNDYGGYWWGTDGNASSSAHVEGGDGNDLIDVHVTSTAYAWWLGDTTATSSAEVYGGAGDDDISVVVEAHRSSGFWWWSTNGTANATVEGNDGNDHIFVDALTSTITGGAGNDSIDLAVRADAGDDTLMFGNINYDALQHVSLDTQGTDTITGFNMEFLGAGAEDQMDFSAFLGAVNLNNGGQPEYADWRAGTTTLDMTTNGGNVAVIEANAGFTLTAANISQQENPIGGTLQIGGTTLLGAEGRTVVIVATDTNSAAGFDHFDVYYVQDVDQDYGAAWKVDLVGQIDSATEVGAISSVDAANIVT